MNNKLLIGILGRPSYDDKSFPIIALYNDYKDVVIKINKEDSRCQRDKKKF